jgi:CRISPR system Cascade subunit CasD
MQSWGLKASFDERFTETMPTKSGVLGIIGAALGLKREDESGLKELSGLKMLAACVKDGIIIKDFHTVMDVPCAEGRAKTVVTNRQYLCDYKFIVVLAGSPELIDRCSSALRNPHWFTGLGRRSCLPSEPIYVGAYSDTSLLKESLSKLGYNEECRIICESDTGSLENDVPINYAKREFSVRQVSGNPADFCW